jgi:uncharacterized protein with PIN domain
MDHHAEFRFYEELNDFLPPEYRKRSFACRFRGTPRIGEAIEALGIPLEAVDLILVNGDSAGLDHRLQPNDRVAVYPVFESFDIASLVRLREKPLRELRFVVDANLGELAALLRSCGFDTRHSHDVAGPAIGRIAAREKRIVLTRNREPLGDPSITHAYRIRSARPREQLAEVIRRFDLGARFAEFVRCLRFDRTAAPISKGAIVEPDEDTSKFNEK